MRYALWECDGHIDPYNSKIPSGTKCTSTCPIWRGFEGRPLVLESTCVEGNQWTSTRPSKSDTPVLRLSPYDFTVYNTPDLGDMICGCQDVGPFDYNPNTEDEAELLCTGGQPKNFDAPGGWNLTTTDRCDFFCNKGKYILRKILKTSQMQSQLFLCIATALAGLESQRKDFGATVVQKTQDQERTRIVRTKQNQVIFEIE